MFKYLPKKIFFFVLAIALLGAGFYGGLSYNHRHLDQTGHLNPATSIINQSQGKPSTVDFSLFWQVMQRLEERFADQAKLADKRKLVFGAIEGMVNSLGDPYTVFLEPEESKKFEEQISGSFSGVGIEIGMRKGLLTVIAPIKNSPAEKVGIRAGDIITIINEKDASGITIDQAVSKIRGKKGTVVKLTIQRPDIKEPKVFSIVRDDIKIPTIDWKLVADQHGNKNIAHIQLFVFNRNVDDEFSKIAKEVIASPAEKIILDLRNNPGGLLDSAVNIASWFLDQNQTVVSERFADQTETLLKTQNLGGLKKYPLVIIINKGSASASEILAGALRDDRGIKIVGETSFGKGSVQELVDFPGNTEGGGKATLKVTIAKWFTPSGISISDEGIKPDLKADRTEDDLTKNKDPQLDRAIEIISQ